MGIEVSIKHEDYMAVIAELERTSSMLRLQLESAKRTIRELDLATPEGASRLIGVATYGPDEEDDDEVEVRSVQDEG